MRLLRSFGNDTAGESNEVPGECCGRLDKDDVDVIKFRQRRPIRFLSLVRLLKEGRLGGEKLHNTVWRRY